MSDGCHELRRARPRDAHDIAGLFQLVYAESSHPCKDVDFVSASLERRREDVWHVSAMGDRVTGCMGMLPHRWNRSWEMVRGVVHPDFRGGGLATELAQRVVDEAWASGECDVIIANPRSRTMYRIVSEVIRPPVRVTGHDGGINIVNGTREFHLVAVSFSNAHTFERIVPARREAIPVFVWEQVFGPFDLPAIPGDYPPVLIAGEYPHHPDFGPFTFSYHPFCPSDSLEITAYTGPKREPTEIAHDLLRTLESFAYARHVRLAVLVDKTAFQAALLAAGFAVTAYLPAWHLQNGVRYDCLLMTKRTTDDEPIDHGTRDLIDHFNAGYATCRPSATA